MKDLLINYSKNKNDGDKMLKIYDIKKYKNKTFKLMVGVLIGASLTGCGNTYSYEEEMEQSEENDIASYKIPLEEKLKTKGALDIKFDNIEYIDKINSDLKRKADELIFYDDKGVGYGVVISDENIPTSTLSPGEYKFYSEYLGIEGEFTIDAPGDFKTLEIDYKTKSYDIYSESLEKNKIH